MSSNNTKIEMSDPDDGKIVSDEIFFYFKVVNIVVLTQAFDILGSVTNVINMVVFVKIGFSDTINISLMALSISDFGACFLLIWRTIVLNPWFQEIDDLPFQPTDMSYLLSTWPHIIFARVTTLLTAFIAIERCICVTMPFKVKSIVTRERVKRFVVCCYISVALTALPIYLTKGYDYKFYPRLNKTLIGLVYSDNMEEIQVIVLAILNVFFSLIPFIIISATTYFLVSALHKNTNWKRTANVNNEKMSTKENRVVKMVSTMSILFICCYFPLVAIQLMVMMDSELAVDGKKSNLLISMGSFLFLLESINSSCNIFIYYSNSSIYKTTFKSIFSCRKSGESEINCSSQ